MRGLGWLGLAPSASILIKLLWDAHAPAVGARVHLTESLLCRNKTYIKTYIAPVTEPPPLFRGGGGCDGEVCVCVCVLFQIRVSKTLAKRLLIK